MLKPYMELSTCANERFDFNVSVSSNGVKVVEGIINKNDNINLSIYETEDQNIAVFVIHKKDTSPKLGMNIFEDKDVLLSEEGKRVTKKLLETDTQVFSVQIMNNVTEPFLNDKVNFGGYFTSNGTKLLQLFVSKETMDKEEFKSSVLYLINKGI